MYFKVKYIIAQSVLVCNLQKKEDCGFKVQAVDLKVR